MSRTVFHGLATAQFGHWQASANVEELLWHIYWGAPDFERRDHRGNPIVEHAERCIGTVMYADVRARYGEAGCGDMLYMAACLGCDWEGTQTREEDAAVEDCCDHAWPGWRDLPVIDLVENWRETPKKAAQRFERQTRECNKLMPGWSENGGPVRRRVDHASQWRHHWNGGRWRIAVEDAEPAAKPEPRTEKKARGRRRTSKGRQTATVGA